MILYMFVFLQERDLLTSTSYVDIHHGLTQFLNNPPSTDVGLRREWVFLPPALNGSQKHQSAAKDVVTMSCDVQVHEMPRFPRPS